MKKKEEFTLLQKAYEELKKLDADMDEYVKTHTEKEYMESEMYEEEIDVCNTFIARLNDFCMAEYGKTLAKVCPGAESSIRMAEEYFLSIK